MRRNNYFIKRMLPAVILLVMAIHLKAQDSLKRDGWPGHIKLQFAGVTGFSSIGAGYSSRNRKWEADLMYGYVPESVGGITMHSISAKLTYIPFRPLPLGLLSFKPLTAGVLVSHTFGKQFFGFDPENYPFNYYDFPTSFFAAAFVGGQLQTAVKSKCIRNIGLYYEVLTVDRLFMSYVQNTRALDLDDVISLGIGLRIERK